MERNQYFDRHDVAIHLDLGEGAASIAFDTEDPQSLQEAWQMTRDAHRDLDGFGETFPENEIPVAFANAYWRATARLQREEVIARANRN